MLPYLVTLVGLIALVVSLHKERLLAPTGGRSAIRAIRLHHVVQLAAVALSLYVAVDSEREGRELRSAQLDAEAAYAAAKHAAPILDLYFLKLLPTGAALKNLGNFEDALSGTHLSVHTDLILERVSPGLVRQRQAALGSFHELQRTARNVLAESTIYGARYPAEMVKWAQRTLELKESDLPSLLVEGPVGFEYAELTGRSIGVSAHAVHDAHRRIER